MPRHRLDDWVDTGAIEGHSPRMDAPREELSEWKATAEKAAIRNFESHI